jgi:lysophospholipase L1-like esterase
MCAGDSITYGWTDPQLNGYRAPLYNLLTDAGAQVRMVGTVNSGDFAPSSASEGFNGAEIAVLANNLKGTRLLEPNVVLLCIGTNDINLNDDVGNAPDRLSQLLDEMFGLYQQSYIVVATIPPIGTAASEARAVTYNAAIPGVVKQFKDQGRNITLADINSVVSFAWVLA